MKHRAVIGIEISKNEVRGAAVRPMGGGMQLTGVATVPTPPDAFDAEGLINADSVGEAVRAVCTQLDPRASHVVVGMTNCNLVARVMEIPPVPDSEVRAVLRGEMDHYRILPAGQSAFDYYRLPDMPPPEGEVPPEEEVARVLLMGAEERLVASYRAAIDVSGMGLVAVEPGAIAILRALYPILRHEDAVATVMLSTSGTDIFITHNGDLRFYRRVDTGVTELHVLQSAQNTGSATGRIRGAMLIGDEEEMEDLSPQAPVVEESRFNRQAMSLLMTEVQRSIDYYLREFPSANEKMLVRFAIDSPDATDLFTAMIPYLRSEAEMASAFDALSVAPEASVAVSGEQGFRFIVAVGLALRGAGGEYAGAPALDLGVGDRMMMERRSAPKALVASLALSGLILLGTIVAAIFVGARIGSTLRTLEQSKEELKLLTAEHAARVARLERQKNLVEAIHRRDKPVREAVEFLAASISRHACLTSMAIDHTGSILLSGETVSPRIIADIMDTINLATILEPINLTGMTRAGSNEGIRTLRFELKSKLMQPAMAAAASPSPPNAAGSSAPPSAPPAKNPSGGS